MITELGSTPTDLPNWTNSSVKIAGTVEADALQENHIFLTQQSLLVACDPALSHLSVEKKQKNIRFEEPLDAATALSCVSVAQTIAFFRLVKCNFAVLTQCLIGII